LTSDIDTEYASEVKLCAYPEEFYLPAREPPPDQKLIWRKSFKS
jgi:hypothetical protein